MGLFKTYSSLVQNLQEYSICIAILHSAAVDDWLGTGVSRHCHRCQITAGLLEMVGRRQERCPTRGGEKAGETGSPLPPRQKSGPVFTRFSSRLAGRSAEVTEGTWLPGDEQRRGLLQPVGTKQMQPTGQRSISMRHWGSGGAGFCDRRRGVGGGLPLL